MMSEEENVTEESKKKEKVFIIADSRESRSKILKALQGIKNCEVEIKQLEAGDYVVSDMCAVSVKASISDFCQSLSGGGAAAAHLFDELKRMKDAYEIPVLILNGVLSFDFKNNRSFTYRPMWSKEAGKMINVKVDLKRPPASIIGALAAIARMGVPIIQTTNEHYAAQVIFRLAYQEQINEKRPLKIQKAKKAGLTLPERQRLVVESLVGPVTAEALLNKFGTPLNVFNATEDQLKETKGVGDKRAKEIREILTTKYVSIEKKGEEKEEEPQKSNISA